MMNKDFHYLQKIKYILKNRDESLPFSLSLNLLQKRNYFLWVVAAYLSQVAVDAYDLLIGC